MVSTQDVAITPRYAGVELHKLVDAPLHALQDLSDEGAAALKRAFHCETIGQLGANHLIVFAAWIAFLGETDASGESQVHDRTAYPDLTARALLQSNLVGMWADRDELGDSVDYARSLREDAHRVW